MRVQLAAVKAAQAKASAAQTGEQHGASTPVPPTENNNAFAVDQLTAAIVNVCHRRRHQQQHVAGHSNRRGGRRAAASPYLAVLPGLEYN